MPLVDQLGLILSPAASPAIGDVPTRGPSGGWTTASAFAAAPNSVLTFDPVGGTAAWAGGAAAALPAAGVAYRGRVMTVASAPGVADGAYVCLKSSADTYSWKLLVAG